MLFIGIDPGRSGAVAILDAEDVNWIPLNAPQKDIVEFFKSYNLSKENCAISLEKVWAMRGQGVSSSFKFGTNFGWCQGVLDCLELPYLLPSPQSWQKELEMIVYGTRTSAEKKACNVARATEWFTGINKTNVDALLLAVYSKRIYERCGIEFFWQTD